MVRLDEREFVDYLWLSIPDALDRVAQNRREHAQAVLSELEEILEKTA
ncbi:MAG: hypothetical protein R3B41_03335 [Candidatus Doudnabacteria bacterium]